MANYIQTLISLYIPTVETDEEYEGQGMVEYGLILALVSIAAIAALIILGPRIAEIFSDVTTGLDGEVAD